MRDYVLRRIALMIPLMLGVSFLTFLAFRIIPGDIVDFRCGFGCDEAAREALREQLGLNRPWYEQYFEWMTNVLQGDFGRSLGEGQLPLTTELERRMPITLEIMVLTIIFTIMLGIPLGIISAVRPGATIDHFLRFFGVLGLSVPNFYLGVLIVVFAAAWFDWSPPQFGRGYVSPTEDPWVNIQQFFFPAIVLAIGSAAVIMRILRSSLLEVLRNDYIRTAWSKGLRERAVITRHALKNAMIPVLTILGLEAGSLIGGSVIMESIFGLNGLGSYILYTAVTRDIVVVQSIVFLAAFAYVTINLFVDVAYGWLDPRVRVS